MIASGPTVENMDSEQKGWEVVLNHQIEKQLPSKVVECLSSSQTLADQDIQFSHVQNCLIGSNLTALQAAEAYASQLGLVTAIISDHIKGEAKEVGQHFAQLAQVIARMMTNVSNEQHQYMEALSVAAENLYIDPRYCCKLERLVHGCYKTRKNLCLIGGGETTVTVQGSGQGGRNQEMVLSFLKETASEDWLNDDLDVVFLSAGTDGIDGPTNAAGAIAYQGLFGEAQLQGLDPSSYLNNNNSYEFFRLLHQGACHVITGPSGTNVMDIHILCLKWK